MTDPLYRRGIILDPANTSRSIKLPGEREEEGGGGEERIDFARVETSLRIRERASVGLKREYTSRGRDEANSSGRPYALTGKRDVSFAYLARE